MEDIQELIKRYDAEKSQEVYERILENLKKQDTLWFAFFPNTRNFYVDIVNEKAVVYVFTKQEYYENYQDYILQQMLIVEAKESSVKDRMQLFADLYRCGIENLVIDNGQTFLGLAISDLVEKPNYDGVPEINVPVTNPHLIMHANIFFQELSRQRATDELQNDMFRDIYNGKFLMPMDSSKMEMDKSESDGTVCTVKKDSTMSFPLITNVGNKSFYPIFTDWVEFLKYDTEKKYSGFIVKFDDLKAFAENSDGIVINPFGANIPMNTEMLAGAEAVGQNKIENCAKATAQPYEVKEDTKVLLGEPKEYPQKMVDAISAYLKKHKNVKQAFLQLMINDEEKSYLIVVDFSGDKDTLFQGIADAAMPYLNGMYLDLVPYDQDFGKNSVKGKQPFFKKKKWLF